MLAGCSQNAQRKLASSCSVKVAEKNSKVVDVKMPSGRRITLKLRSADIAQQWCEEIDFAVHKLAFREALVASVQSEVKKHAAEISKARKIRKKGEA